MYLYTISKPPQKKKKEQNKQTKKKTSVTYNIYTKCKEALQNIMLLR